MDYSIEKTLPFEVNTSSDAKKLLLFIEAIFASLPTIEIENFDWVSGNQICKDIAARLNQTAQSNNTWSYYLGIKNDKSKWASLPSSDEDRIKSGTKKAKK